ncbi:signal peptide peptidase SppA, 36K type [Halobiforma nitratireducens JCM 10879]|uniref:Signal peptide peptidase SppA, 36K type n=2 Tax=Halobiforma nitratireducens TaxID=130048 RepID=M0MKH5_9EURY|nr:signal peptide peptidase SppA, 36K type [Halobiforma nitratireducens JCM 10879]
MAATAAVFGWFVAAGDELDIAAVDIEGKITRSGGFEDDSADDIVAGIELADEQDAEGLLVRINSPGGPVGPSEDIRRAIDEFDGPTVAVAEDTCASGGYLIATACDHIVAREHSLVGSIGVIGSRPNASELADDLGVDYQRLTAGEYKDAGHPLKDPDNSDWSYLQGLIDNFYETFCRRVAEARAVPLEDVKATEARVFTGAEAQDLGFVDDLGTESDARAWLADQLTREEDDLEVSEYETPTEIGDLLSPTMAAQKLAYAFGAGIASRFSADQSISIEYRRK